MKVMKVGSWRLDFDLERKTEILFVHNFWTVAKFHLKLLEVVEVNESFLNCYHTCDLNL